MEFDGFDWDDGNRAKCAKHGLALQDIEDVFADGVVIAPDDAHSYGEQRFIAVGMYKGERPVFVAFTVREREGERLVRPVSARFMHAKEARRYGQERSEKSSGHDD